MLRILWRFGVLLLVVVGCCGVVVACGVVVGMFAGGTAAVPKSAQSWYCCCWSWCVVWWQVVCGDHGTWLPVMLVVFGAHVEICVRMVSMSNQRKPPACVSTVVW